LPVIAALKQYGGGEKVIDVYRKLAVDHVLHGSNMPDRVCRTARIAAVVCRRAAGSRLIAGPADPPRERLKKAIEPRHPVCEVGAGA
jgi:hypothetical protein